MMSVHPVFLRHHRVAHLAWCRRHLCFNCQDWTDILSTDESRFYCVAEQRQQVLKSVVLTETASAEVSGTNRDCEC